MSFDRYIRAGTGDSEGARFDGAVTQTAISTALGTSDREDQNMRARLEAWGVERFGPDAFGGVANETSRLSIFELPRGRRVLTRDITGRVRDLLFTADSRYLIVGTISPPDYPTRVFEVDRGWREISRIPNPGVAMLGPIVGGRYILTASTERARSVSVYQHSLRPDDLISEICSRLSRNLTHTTWAEVFGDEPYRRTCPALRQPEDARVPTAGPVHRSSVPAGRWGTKAAQRPRAPRAVPVRRTQLI